MSDADTLISTTLTHVMNQGMYIATEKDSSWELCDYQTIPMTDIRSRIFTNPNRPLNIVTAVARFTWLVAGNNRVEDIAFYEPKVRNFSDDKLTVPGSDYGLRIFQPRPGLNQIEGVVERLRHSPYSRQAAAVVWQPEDAVRQSGDIPCTFGMFFRLRPCPDGEHAYALHMTTVMRSNNAFRILPFNVFEFTMLHELVAAELGVGLGSYKVWAASMHAYDNPRETPATRAIADGEVSESITMDPMPQQENSPLGTDPLVCARHLAILEASLRHACDEDEYGSIVLEALNVLPNYWLDLFGVLAAWGAAKRNWGPQYSMISNSDIRDLTAAVCQKV